MGAACENGTMGSERGGSGSEEEGVRQGMLAVSPSTRHPPTNLLGRPRLWVMHLSHCFLLKEAY